MAADNRKIEHPRNVLFVIFCILNAVMLIFQYPFFGMVMPWLNFYYDYAKVNVYLNGCVSQFQLLLFVIGVLACYKKGYILSMLITFGSIILCIIEKLHGSQRPVLLFVTYIIADILITSVIYFQLVRVEKHAKKIDRMYYTDDLTNLPNRKMMLSVITKLISNTKNCPAFAFIFVDLDDFKAYNDLFGPEAGDKILKEAGVKLANSLSQNDYISRMSGDEFSIAIKGDFTPQELFIRIRMLAAALSEPFFIRNKEIKLTACFGVTQYPKDAKNTVAVLKSADMALLRAKSQGKDKVCLFDEEMQKVIETRMSREHHLKNAIGENELYLEYQPQFVAETGKLRGFESLCRWNSKALGRVSPADFIPIAEDNGDIVGIGKWILEKACSDYMSVFGGMENGPVMSVNVSAVQLKDPDFVHCVKRIIEKTNMNVKNLELELTESVSVFAWERVIEIFTDLRSLGISIALDDFGTGFSSLKYLKSLPLDVIKIDNTFTGTILKTEENKNLLKPIIEMAHQLDLEVVAEGVEVDEELQYLKKNTCDYIQGFLFAKPMKIDEIKNEYCKC